MTLVEQLSRLHRDISGCTSVVFGDVRTGTVLRAFADADLRQEDHDTRLTESADCLGSGAAECLATMLGTDPDSTTIEYATLRDADHTRVCLRLDPQESDVICASFGNVTPPATLAVALQRVASTDE